MGSLYIIFSLPIEDFQIFPARGRRERGSAERVCYCARERNSSQASKLVNESLLFTRVISKTRRQMILKFFHNILRSILFVHSVFYWIRPQIGDRNRFILLLSTAFRISSCKVTQLSAQFAKKLCSE